METREACKKHPRYQALRKPRADCSTCRELFKIAESERNKTTNMQGKEVTRGMHICSVCNQKFEEYRMHWTDSPKLCIGCYYDL